MRVDGGWLGEYDFEQEHGRIFYAWVMGWKMYRSREAETGALKRLYDALEEGLLSFELIASYAPPQVLINFESSHVGIALEGMLFRTAVTLASALPEYRERYLRSPWGQALQDPDYLEEILIESNCENRAYVKATLGL